MKHSISHLLLFFLCFTLGINAQESFFTLQPTLTPNGETIIFSYQGDLWKVASSGGDAFRLTAMDGNEMKQAQMFLQTVNG